MGVSIGVAHKCTIRSIDHTRLELVPTHPRGRNKDGRFRSSSHHGEVLVALNLRRARYVFALTARSPSNKAVYILRLYEVIVECDHLSLSLATQHSRSAGPARPMVLYRLNAIRPGKASPFIATTGTATKKAEVMHPTGEVGQAIAEDLTR